jgi:hypothetical protein
MVTRVPDPLLTGAFRAKLERSQLTEFGLQPTEKTRIVWLEWSTGNTPPTTRISTRDGVNILGRPHDA